MGLLPVVVLATRVGAADHRVEHPIFRVVCELLVRLWVAEEQQSDALGEHVRVQGEVALQYEDRFKRQALLIERDLEGLQLLVCGSDEQCPLAVEVQLESPVAVGELRDGDAVDTARRRHELAVLHQDGELCEDDLAQQGVRFVDALLRLGFSDNLGVPPDLVVLDARIVFHVGDFVNPDLEPVEDSLVGSALPSVLLPCGSLGNGQV